MFLKEKYYRYKLNKLKPKLFFFANGTSFLKKEASDKEIAFYIKNKKNINYEFKYGLNYPGLFFKANKLKIKKYIYYIPNDIFKYLKYDGNEIILSNDIPENIKRKAIDCARFMEVEINYLYHIKKCNFISNEFIECKNKNRILKPTIEIQSSNENILSFESNYKEKIECSYIQKYDYYKKIEEEMKNSDKYLF